MLRKIAQGIDRLKDFLRSQIDTAIPLTQKILQAIKD